MTLHTNKDGCLRCARLDAEGEGERNVLKLLDLYHERAEKAEHEAATLNDDASFWRRKTMEARREAERLRDAYLYEAEEHAGPVRLPWEREGGDDERG